MARTADYGRYLRMAVEEQVMADEALRNGADCATVERHVGRARHYRAKAAMVRGCRRRTPVLLCAAA